jgi:hypothetical protein
MEKQLLAGKKGRSEKAAHTRAAIIRLLGWSELEWANYQYENGLLYLQGYLPDDDEAQDVLQRSRIFWTWWKNHWTNRDEHFIDTARLINDSELLAQVYLEMHDGRLLSGNIYPNRFVITESFKTKTHETINH